MLLLQALDLGNRETLQEVLLAQQAAGRALQDMSSQLQAAQET